MPCWGKGGGVEIGVVAEVGAAGAAGESLPGHLQPQTFLHLLLAALRVPQSLGEENWNTNNTQGHPQPSLQALRQPLTDPHP